MSSTNTLREQRANIWEQMKDIVDRAEAEKREMTGEEQATYDRLEKDLDDKGAALARAERHESREEAFLAEGRRGAVPPAGFTPDGDQPDSQTAYASAFRSWVRGGDGRLSNSDRELMQARFDSSIQNAAGVGSGAAGGYLVPPAFRDKIVEAIKSYSAMRTWAEVITTETGADLPWPTVDDTSNEGAILAENTQVTEQDVTMGTAKLGAFMYTSKLVRVSLQLLNDNAVDLESRLAVWLGARIGRIQNRHFTVGTGTSQPLGIVTGAAVGATGAAGQLADVKTDDLIELTESVDAGYLEGGNAAFMMSQTTRKGLRKLKDSTGQYLWQPSLAAGTPDTVLGYPLRLNNYMASPGANAKTVGFGDIREAYVIRDVNEITLVRFGERFMDYLQVGFLAFARSDGTTQNAAAFKVFQHAAA